ncbi:uncharacterized protein KY384_000573 [Bacidia gigantensis]|uniref:uncharacterized protein n=1 Tax=Bacidia gigantensis TaxID=2732470 RepID=UPI001D03DE90|nr:uncharacterized protein KY384_000573 [Bacidia gigantensis]KAG8525813.1 hypothetical protein KY384_000573 [Bacidia gigantensis]
MTLTYARLLYVVIANPGYTEVNPDHKERTAGQEKIPQHQRPGLQEFIKRDLFICQGDGQPIWCSQCQNWKPDRTHHCREVDRCVHKMDHFCPWVGGVVSETSFKFFVQFVAYTAIYCTFVLILVAVLLHEYVKAYHKIHVHWVVTLAMAALFGLFTVGMTGSSLQFALVNTTTIENLSRKTVVYQLAIHLPRPPQERPPFPTISFPVTQPTAYTDIAGHGLKTFAILHSRPGDNPWDLGAFGNFKSVMGEQWYDWLLPLKYSPCTKHDRCCGPEDETRSGYRAIGGKASSQKKTTTKTKTISATGR